MAKQGKPFTKVEVAIASPIIRAMSVLNTWIYRATRGKLTGRFRSGAPILLLTMTGRKSGREITQPLLYLQDGVDLLIVASKGGMDHHPVWYLNLVANPNCEVQVGDATTPMRARTATPEEKRSYWPKLVQMYPDYADYQARTTRDIPVVVLSPRS